jgi:hypothetical protein
VGSKYPKHIVAIVVKHYPFVSWMFEQKWFAITKKELKTKPIKDF